MKILLTGARGQLGVELGRSLMGLGQLVKVDRAGMDLSKLDQVRSVVRTVRPDLIVNAAAYTAVDRAESESALAQCINADAPALMASEAALLGAALVHFSTDYVFDGARRDAYLETDVPNPLNVYGASKLAGEQAIAQAGVKHLILRTSWLYGTQGNNFLTTMLRLAREHGTLRVVADQLGTPTSHRFVAEATAVALRQAGSGGVPWWREHGGLYHLSCAGSTSWHGFAAAIMAAAQSDCPVLPITAAEYAGPARRPSNSALSSDKFAARFCAIPDWNSALLQCMALSA